MRLGEPKRHRPAEGAAPGNTVSLERVRTLGVATAWSDGLPSTTLGTGRAIGTSGEDLRSGPWRGKSGCLADRIGLGGVVASA